MPMQAAADRSGPSCSTQFGRSITVGMTIVARNSDIAQRRALARKNDDPEYRLRRADLVKAAAAVFRRKGFSAAKLQDIAAEIGLDRASVYYYVSNKEELYKDVVSEAVLENVIMVEKLRTEDQPANQKLSTFIERVMGSYERHYPYLYVYVQEDMAHIDEDRAWNREMRLLGRRFNDAVRDIIQKGLDDGSLRFPVRDARLIANGVIGMLNWSHRWFQPDGQWTAKMVGETFSTMILRGLARGGK
jgi:TetR/AcrR family transcriptional regulator, cholesterol catabolism regulator